MQKVNFASALLNTGERELGIFLGGLMRSWIAITPWPLSYTMGKGSYEYVIDGLLEI